MIHVEHARMMHAFLDDDIPTLADAIAVHIRNSEKEYLRLLARFDERKRELRGYASTGST